MEKSSENEQKKKAVCGSEALDLLNCVAQSNFDQEKCVSLLQSLRQCILTKKVKKFSLAGDDTPEAEAKASGKKQQQPTTT